MYSLSNTVHTELNVRVLLISGENFYAEPLNRVFYTELFNYSSSVSILQYSLTVNFHLSTAEEYHVKLEFCLGLKCPDWKCQN